MARLPPHLLGARVPSLGGSASLRGVDVLPTVALLEQKVATQLVEIQRLVSENQKLATTHVALRQELAITQQEFQRVQQAFTVLQAEKEQQVRALVEKTAKLEADVRAIEPLKVELDNAKAGAHKLLALRQELSNQITQLTQELHRARTDVQQVPTIKAEMEGLQQEIQRARTAFEFEKKANTELLEQRGAMEKNLVSMAREVEKLRAELTNAESKARVGAYAGRFGAADSGRFGAADSGYPSASAYGDAYGLSQMSVAAENGLPFGSGSAGAWAYDLQRASGLRR